MTVLDASIVVRLLLNRPGDADLRARIGVEDALHAPTVIDAEVASAIRGLMITAKNTHRISAMRAGQMVDDFEDLAIKRHPMLPLVSRVLELRHNLTAYDAFYVALAEALDVPLLTGDQKFARAPGHHAEIETWR